MGAKAEAMSGLPDTVKWLCVAVLVVAGIAGFHYFADESFLLRVVALLVVVGAAFFVALQTETGKLGWEFVRESRTEVRKVVWPTRKETTQTTGLVIAMVAVVAIFLWILDSFLGWAVRVLLGG